MVESKGNARAYNPDEHAVGHLQIRQCVIDDVNRLNLLPYKVKLINAYNPKTAEQICRVYLGYWMYLTGQSTAEAGARIWCSGPDGWWQLNSIPYWKKVAAEMDRQALNAALDTHAILSPQTNNTWQPPQISPSPAVPSASTPDTTAKSSSRSDLAITFTFDSNAKEATGNPSTSSPFTIKPKEFRLALGQESQPGTSVHVRIHVPGGSNNFTFHVNP